MSDVRKPLLTDETGREILEAVDLSNSIAAEVSRGGSAAPETPDHIQRMVRSGMAKKYYNIGDQIVVPWTDEAGTVYQMPFDVVHFGDVTLQDGEVIPGMWLQSHYATPYGVQFSQFQAMFEPEAEMPAGDYYFEIASTWSKAAAGNYTFTLTEPVPVGGQVCGPTTIADTEPETWKVRTYADANSTTPIETVSVSSGSDGTKIGVLSAEGTSPCNSIQRIGYGSNRWAKSAIRQWLNSDAAIGAWWSKADTFDRAPDQLATKRGFIAGFEDEFKAILTPVKVTTALNTVTDSGIGTSEDTYDKFFLPSLQEIYCTPQLADTEGTAWEYWRRALGRTTPAATGTAYPAYVNHGIENHASAQPVRLRSAYRGAGGSAWNMNPGGNVYGYNSAYNAFRCCPACVIC